MGGIWSEHAILRKSAEERAATPGYVTRVSVVMGPLSGPFSDRPHHSAESLCRVRSTTGG